ncbi:DUF2063 domain-containing protein [Vibrio sp. TRT 17S01]|uniref:DUF2063 domain-containing protein n=1 Tax=Vibrio sp. TRT 17S01 TaxID=3418505 RepID=UPI003CEA9F94
MLNVSNQMHAQTESLTALIRTPAQQGSLCRYGEFIRENILGVVTNTFPLFCSEFDSKQIEKMVDDFVVLHGANEPEFHHIATEFTLFVIQERCRSRYSCLISSDQMALLEFEWVLFCAEIDELDTAHFNGKTVPMEQNYTLLLNPTLRLLQVPFLLHEKSVTFLENRHYPVFYAVFRNHHHVVISQRLREVDVALIQRLQPPFTLTFAQLQQYTAQRLVRFCLVEWVQYFNELGVLATRPLGE